MRASDVYYNTVSFYSKDLLGIQQLYFNCHVATMQGPYVIHVHKNSHYHTRAWTKVKTQEKTVISSLLYTSRVGSCRYRNKENRRELSFQN